MEKTLTLYQKRVIKLRNFANRRKVSRMKNVPIDCNQINVEDVSNAFRDFILEKRSFNSNDQYKPNNSNNQKQ